MKRISFYRTASGKCPVQDYLDSLTDTQATKVAWVLKLIRETDQIPSRYFKKLVSTDDIWEARIDVGKNTFRLLGFFIGKELIILTNSFQKKSQKTPQKEIRLAEKKKNTLTGDKTMDDLDEYIGKRKKLSPEFAKNFDKGYEQFKIGILLKQARLEACLTQEQVANILNTKKSAISRIENHAEDIRLSTLVNYAQAVGKNLHLQVA